MGNTPSAPPRIPNRSRTPRVTARRTPPPAAAPSARKTECSDVVRIPAAVQFRWNPAKAAKLYEFVPKDGSSTSIMWHLGKQTPEEFAESLLDIKAKFISAQNLKVYFRINKDHCARRVFSSSSGFTLSKLLHHVHSAAVSGAVMAIKKGNPSVGAVCQKDVDAFLSRRVIKCLYLSASQVYVNVREESA